MALEDFSPWTSEVIRKNERGEDAVKRKNLPSICREPSVIYPLGFQPFMRCHMQSGYGMYMREPYPLQKDFEFEKLKFKQSVELSRKVYEINYGIMIHYRGQIPEPSPMFEPWMLRTIEDEPGTVDFKLREKVECGDSIMNRNMIGLLATLMKAKLQDF